MPKSITFKNYWQELHLFNHRLIVAITLCILLIGVIIGRLVYLQIMQHHIYTTLSDQNQLTLLPIEPKRGLIYDRNGVLLAENIPVFTLEIVPEKIKSINSTINALQKVIPITEEEIATFKKLLKEKRRFTGVPLKPRLTEEDVARFSVNQYRFPEVIVHAHLIRHYPMGKIMAPILGFVGRINQQELTKVDPVNYSATEYIGKVGIEKYYETILHGTIGNQQIEADANGHIVRVLKQTPSVAGDNLTLTIDSKLQKLAMNALDESAGAIVAIDPTTGAVLALASNPSYDPNSFVDGISYTEYKQLQDHPKQPLYNRAIRGLYPLASTIKPILGLEALDQGIVDLNYHIVDPGYFKLKTSAHIYHDDVPYGHGVVNVERAIRVSCDTFFYTLASHAGIKFIDNALSDFGYGKLTGIDMGEEVPGIISSPEWKRKKLKAHWYAGDTIISAIGQGYMLVTPLQAANAIAQIANRGQRFKPYLLLAKHHPDNTLDTTQPTPLPKLNINPDLWNTVINAMQSVITSPEGTAYKYFRGVNYPIAGKSGTAQVFHQTKIGFVNQMTLPEKLRNHAWFVSFTPIDKPKIALAVLVEHNTNAKKITREILDHYLGTPPKSPQQETLTEENNEEND